MLEDTSLFGSRIFTGYLVFRGKEGTDVGNADILNLQDLIAAVYAGQVTDEAASKCVFMPEAQGGEVDTVLERFVIYREHHPTEQALIRFAMRRSGNDDPLLTGPVRYVGRETFTTRNGTVRLIPVVALEEGIK